MFFFIQESILQRLYSTRPTARTIVRYNNTVPLEVKVLFKNGRRHDDIFLRLWTTFNVKIGRAFNGARSVSLHDRRALGDV